MDFKKTKAPTDTTTFNVMDFCKETGNIYESVVIMSKRANQISAEMKDELIQKLREFATSNETLEETFEKRLPKPTLIAIKEFQEGNIYFRNPEKEKNRLDD